MRCRSTHVPWLSRVRSVENGVGVVRRRIVAGERQPPPQTEDQRRQQMPEVANTSTAPHFRRTVAPRQGSPPAHNAITASVRQEHPRRCYRVLDMGRCRVIPFQVPAFKLAALTRGRSVVNVDSLPPDAYVRHAVPADPTHR